MAKFDVKVYLTMPLHEIHWSGPGSGWAVWRVEEEPEFLANELPQADQCPEMIVFPRKRLEWLGGRYLLRYMFREAGLSYNGLTKDEFGKPHPIGSDVYISLSNAFPFVAAQIHTQIPVGIDLEIPRPKMVQIIPRVLTDLEKKDAAADPQKLCVYWSAKEALYKIYGKRNLSFSENLLLDPFELNVSGSIIGHIITSDVRWRVELEYLAGPLFVLTTTKMAEQE